MITITVEFLTGVAYLDGRAAGSPGQPEWPPHPDRLLMALVAAWGRAGCDGAERAALEWIERQNPPSIAATEAEPTTLVVYSPVNDRLPDVRNQLESVSSDHRGRHLIDAYRAARNKDRIISSSVPHIPQVSYVWEADPPDQIRRSLAVLLPRLTYLGSSESMATAWMASDPPPITWAPSDRAEMQLRVPYGGRLADLVAAYEADTRPGSPAWCGYARPRSDYAASGEWATIMPFEVVGPVDLRHTVQLAQAVRSCLLAACPEPIPAWISGHSPDGDRLRGSHVGVVPLANVGHQYADGRVLGVGLTIPAGVSVEERLRCLSNFCPVPQKIGKHVTMQRVVSPKATLAPDRWTKPATCWGTVTPVACHRWPKRAEIQDVLRRDIAHAGLPPPVKVEILDCSPHTGGLFAAPFDSPKKFRVHAAVHWAEPVAGPIVVGAGRYKGLGLFHELRRMV